jgi:hypothetical protein
VAAAQTFTEYPIPTANSRPEGITTGPDGALWFSESNVNKIGRVTTAGVITEFTLLSVGSAPWRITMGPDAALWFAEWNAGKIGRITTAGVITEFPLPAAGSGPSGITTGPDGALWFTEYVAHKIGRITTVGAFTEFPVPTTGSAPLAITMAPDGALWFIEFNSNQIGRLAPASARDYPTIEAALVLFSVVIMLINFGIDFAYRTFDQRIVVATPAALLPLLPDPPTDILFFRKAKPPTRRLRPFACGVHPGSFEDYWPTGLTLRGS